MAVQLSPSDRWRNAPGVCHQLSNGFELKHDMLSGDEGERSNLQE